VDLLKAVKTGQGTAGMKGRIENLTLSAVDLGLPEDNMRKAFWLNLYNAWYQIFALEEKLERPAIFTHRGIRFNNFTLNLDDIEHGILRRFRSKYSLGYLPQFFPDPVIKKLAVSKLDYRIHFALNCGAKSCPPIQIFDTPSLDSQLDQSAVRFLESETQVDYKQNIVLTTRLMEWFYADFGGKRGQRKILSRYLKKELNGFGIHYRDYDWRDSLMNFGIE
jgi:hypothetical protein